LPSQSPCHRALQPRRNAGLKDIWATSGAEQRRAYAETLCEALKPWFNTSLSASLAARFSDTSILKLTLGAARKPLAYEESGASELDVFLERIAKHLPVRLPGNVQLVPDLRFVISNEMYLVKPMQVRYWLRSTALADAEQIAADLSAAIARQSNTEANHARG
jgi:hypothetical protein